MLSVLLILSMLVTDLNGVSGTVKGVHVENDFTYVQVYFGEKWVVYGLPHKAESIEQVVEQGFMLDEDTGLKLFPLSSTWDYIKKRDYERLKPKN
jgi:hypothetical protein